MKFHWIPLSVLSLLLFCLPARAGKLVNWRFERNQNRIDLITDNAVQPQAQLIFNPTRLVIDLPGTSLGKPTERLTVNQKGINSVRVGQLDAQTTRIVVELASGYTIEPDQVKFRGTYANQWSVTFPDPQPITETGSEVLSPSVDSSSNSTKEVSNSTPAPNPNSSALSESPYLMVTQSGLFISLDNSGAQRVEMQRSRDRRSIEFELEDSQLPGALAGKTIEVNRYGIGSATFTQNEATARITLNINPDSPDWRGTFSRSGDFILLPQGGISAVENLSQPDGANVEVNSDSENSDRNDREEQSTIYGVSVIDNQLVIDADKELDAEGEWNSRLGVYEIEIDDAQLGEISNPQLSANSPVKQIRLQEPEPNKVIVLVEPAAGVEIEQLIDNQNRLFVSFKSSQSAVEQITLSVPQPDKNQVYQANPVVTVPQTTPQPQTSTVPKTKVVVVIDPGHGGKDPGAIGIGGVQEKHIVLPISKMVVERLEQQGVQVIVTRDQDYFVSLQQRADIANRANADLFISIHANAISLDRPDVNGLETYYFQSGQRLAQSIHNSVLRNVTIKDRRVRQARFYVLRKSAMPAVLVEVGFVTGAEDSARLKDPNYQRQMAEAITLGIIEYIRQNH